MVYSSFFFRIGLYFVRIPFLAIFDTFLAVFKHCFIFVSFCHFGYFLVIFRWSWLAVPYPWLCPGCISGGDCNLATILAIFDTFWPFFKNSYIFGFFFSFWQLFGHFFYLIMVSCSISLIMPWLHFLLIKVTLTTLLKLKAKSIGFTFLTIVTLKK